MSWPAGILDPATGEVLLTLVRLSHSGWPADRLRVANTEDIVASGETWTASAFEIAMPDKVEGRAGQMQFRAVDIDGVLFADMRDAEGPIEVEVSWVLASDPDTVHIGPFTSEIRAASQQAGVITGELSAYPAMEEKANARLRFNTIDWPALY